MNNKIASLRLMKLLVARLAGGQRERQTETDRAAPELASLTRAARLVRGVQGGGGGNLGSVGRLAITTYKFQRALENTNARFPALPYLPCIKATRVGHGSKHNTGIPSQQAQV